MTLGMLRQMLGLTQGDLARAVGLTPGALSAIEHGTSHPKLDTAMRIARGLGITADQLDAILKGQMSGEEIGRLADTVRARAGGQCHAQGESVGGVEVGAAAVDAGRCGDAGEEHAEPRVEGRTGTPA